MPDYTPLGIQKIAQQAAGDLTTIRCPRDSAVMRVLASRAEHQDREGLTRRSFQRAPTGSAWRVTELDVECPACRRRALGIRPAVIHQPTDGASRVGVGASIREAATTSAASSPCNRSDPSAL